MPPYGFVGEGIFAVGLHRLAPRELLTVKTKAEFMSAELLSPVRFNCLMSSRLRCCIAGLLRNHRSLPIDCAALLRFCGQLRCIPYMYWCPDSLATDSLARTVCQYSLPTDISAKIFIPGGQFGQICFIRENNIL